MTSNKDKPKPTPLSLRHDEDKELFPNEPKTPHEEVMFVVESTNEIVSEQTARITRIVAKIQTTNNIVSKIYGILETKSLKCDNNPEAICNAPDIVRNWTCRKSGFCPISSGEGC